VSGLADTGAHDNNPLAGLDQVILERVMETARRLYQTILEYLDRLLFEARHKSLAVRHLRPVWLRTCLATVRVRRRQ